MPKTITIDDDQAAEWEQLQEERRISELCAQMGAAFDVGDVEAQARLAPIIPWAPESLRYWKRVRGREYLRRFGFNTELAEKAYGPGWLESEEDEKTYCPKWFDDLINGKG